ncbi:MAG TPA: BlaI/MecI/CopY family transcriptional regulator [Thermoplasmata archaeon]|jgi:predicted transcriptional regulator|nr:BlaI/MecI/CopY family transcriptional regulator [Thermoplasmata archaeon]
MLGSLEREVISVLDTKREATTREVLNDLRGRGKDVAYTTVSTILARLHEKGLIARRNEPFRGGERFVYGYKDIERAYIDSLLDGLVAAFGPAGVVHLARRLESLSREDLESLRRRLAL